MGITAIELAEFYPPYAEVSPMKAMILITRNPPPRLTGTFSPALNDFVARCLCKQPEERPDAPTLLQHPFVAATPSDSADVMRPILDFSTTYRLHRSRGEPAPALDASVRRLTKRSPPPSPARATTTTTIADTAADDQQDCGTVVFHGENDGDGDGTVVFHGNGDGGDGTVVTPDSSGTVVFHDNAGGEDSGTVRIRPAATATATTRTRRTGAVGSLAQQHDAAKRHLTLVSPTACGSGSGAGGTAGSGLVSKRDFFFIIVGAVTQMLIARFLHSLFHGSA